MLCIASAFADTVLLSASLDGACGSTDHFLFLSPDFHELWCSVMSICLLTEVKWQNSVSSCKIMHPLEKHLNYIYPLIVLYVVFVLQCKTRILYVSTL